MAPQAQTVAMPPRLPLVAAAENRDSDSTKDAKLVNCYIEKMAGGHYEIYKRAGLSSPVRTKTGAGRGQFNWNGNIYEIFADTVYKNGTALTGTVDTTNGVYRFAVTRGATPYLIIGNGVKAYTITAADVLAVIPDADFPAAFVKGWAFLDSTLYVMDSSANIWGSALNNPTSWDPLNKIVAQIESDKGVALAKQLAYVIAFKEASTEAFYDAGNATGSPLGPVQGVKIEYGCASAETVQDIDGTLVWVSMRSGGVQVVKMDRLKAEVVSTRPIERLIEKSVNFSTETIFSWQLKTEGHSFYVITFKTANITLAFDLVEDFWSHWSVSGDYVPIVSSTSTAIPQHLVQGESDGNVFYVGREYTNDNGAIIRADIITPNFDGGSKRRKTLSMLEVVGDQVVGSEIKVRFNDNDYDPLKWTNFRTINLANKSPRLPNCGTFVRRATHFRHESNTRMRISAVELQIDMGTI